MLSRIWADVGFLGWGGIGTEARIKLELLGSSLNFD